MHQPHPVARLWQAVRHAMAVLSMLTLALLASPAWAQNAPTADLAQSPSSLDVAGLTLQRNGAGIRYKAIFKVYAAALYLEKPAASLDAIQQLTGPKRISVTMLRAINAAELGKLFAHGMEDNMDKQQFSKLIPGVMRMSDVFSRHKELKTGDTFTLDWIPGKGMLLSVNGVPEPADFPEPEFYHAMLGIWLGPKPADQQLKAALLGNPAR